MTRVLPLPAPASTSTGPLIACTACRCTGLSEASTVSGSTAGRSMDSYDITAVTWPRRPGRREGSRCEATPEGCGRGVLLYVEPAAEGVNEADGPLSAAWLF